MRSISVQRGEVGAVPELLVQYEYDAAGSLCQVNRGLDSEDAGLLGEKISMHHIGSTPLTVPLAATRHLDAHMPGGLDTTLAALDQHYHFIHHLEKQSCLTKF